MHNISTLNIIIFLVPLSDYFLYQFRFDPPRARRDGAWADTLCDTGIGGSAPDPTQTTFDSVGINATGLFRHEFKLPDNWTRNEDFGRIFIVFEGVDSALSVWLNGQFVGYSQDSCLPAEFDITDILKSSRGESSASVAHLLACQVTRWSDGSYLEDQDKWWLSGIYREVYLIRKPSLSRIADFEISYNLQWEGSEGSERALSAMVDLQVLIHGETSSLSSEVGNTGSLDSSPRVLSAELYASSSLTAAVCSMEAVVPPLTSTSSAEHPTASNALPGFTRANKLESAMMSEHCDFPYKYNSAVVSLQGLLPAPHLWSAEDPHLYILVLKLGGVGDEDVEAVRVGFREVRIGGAMNTLQVNRRTLTIAGVNRNEFHCRQGRSVPLQTMQKDIMLLKQLNFNAVRTSHYPSHHKFYELCDAAGIYVVDEANIETHGFQVLGQAVGYLSSLSEWRGSYLARVSRMYERDKNSSCVIGWSLGNESGTGAAHDAMARWIRSRDISGRFLQYESGGSCSGLTDVICPMYRRPEWCEQQAQSDPQRRPVILCEYAHAMGNSAGGLHHYWGLFKNPRLPRLQGGFIWDLVDQGLLLEDEKSLEEEVIAGSKRYKYGGDFKDVPNSRQFCINGILGPDRELHPIAYEAAALQAPISFEITSLNSGKDVYLVVHNRRVFCDFSDLSLRLCLCCNTHASAGSYVEVKLTEENLVPPGGKLTLILKPYWSDLMQNMLEQGRVPECFCIHEYKDAWLDVNVVTNTPTAYVPRGHSVSRVSLRHEKLKNLTYDCIRAFAEEEGSVASGAIANTETFDYGIFNMKKLSPKAIAQARAAFMQRAEDMNYKGADAFWTKWGEFEEAHGDQYTFRDMLKIKNSLSDLRVPISLSVHHETMIDGSIAVTWSNGNRAVVSATCGRLVSWMTADSSAQGKGNIIASPIDLCFWRAPTDNDRGGADFSYFSQWVAYGLNSLQRCPDDTSLDISIETNCDLLCIEARWVLESTGNDKCVIPTRINCVVKYYFLLNGSVNVNFSATLPSNLPPIPRFGLRFSIPGEFDTAGWFGLGPHEAYDDRRACVRTGIFSSPIEDLHTPYVVPQESGRRADPR